MTFLTALLAALAVLPSDRMAMADRLFDRGRYAEAKTEYVALKGAEGVAEDELLYRLAECARALGDKAAARAAYGDLLNRFPLTRHAARARLMRALAGTEAEQRDELRLLDSDQVPAALRATALYHLGQLTNDADAFARCAKLDPSGRYAPFAKFRHAALSADSADPAVRRSAIGELMEIHFGKDKDLAREALYLAAMRSYGDKRHGEASSLFRRYLKVYPNDTRAANARTMAAWSDYLVGKYADAAALCGDGTATEDAAYLLGACAYGMGDYAKARPLLTHYLEAYPNGKYRTAVELPLARMAFDEAEKGEDASRTIEAARRSAALSKSAADRLRLAWAYEKGGRTDEALAEYAAVARDFPGTDDAAESLFRKAMVDLRAQRWSAAELALAEALSSGRNAKRKAESLYWRGVAANMLGHATEGAAHLTEALKLGLSLDQSREARLLLADNDFNAGRAAEAKAAYAKLVREGACDRMSAAKMRSVGRFLLESPLGEPTLEEAKTCARAMVVHADTPEWRQAAFALQGSVEEKAGEFNAAIDSYRRCMAEKIRTEETKAVALALGVLESKAGAYDEAERSLKEAVTLNASDAGRRAQAYLWLARNAEAKGDPRGACAYATVVVSLFDDAALVDAARKILEAHPEEAK